MLLEPQESLSESQDQEFVGLKQVVVVLLRLVGKQKVLDQAKVRVLHSKDLDLVVEQQSSASVKVRARELGFDWARPATEMVLMVH